MFKKVVSKAAADESTGGVPISHPPTPRLSRQLVLRVGYVEDLNDARTQLAGCFSILLVE